MFGCDDLGIDRRTLFKKSIRKLFKQFNPSELHRSRYLSWKSWFHFRYLILFLFYTFPVLSLSPVH